MKNHSVCVLFPPSSAAGYEEHYIPLVVLPKRTLFHLDFTKSQVDNSSNSKIIMVTANQTKFVTANQTKFATTVQATLVGRRIDAHDKLWPMHMTNCGSHAKL
jgi:hypothetical protein